MTDGLTKQRIFDLIKLSREDLASLGIRSIGLFGSFVRGETTDESDIDILLEFDPNMKNYDNFIDTCFLLEQLFNRKVEVVTNESLSPYIRPYVLKEVEYVRLSA